MAKISGIARVLAAVAAMGAIQSPAGAWGVEGHAVIADVAENLLTPTALKNVQKLLAVDHVEHMAQIASWADEMKAAHLPGSPSHTIRLPITGAAPGPHPCPGGFCADDAIAKYSAILGNAKYPAAAREIALKYIVHLVGDLHQPLHTVDASGSNIPVIFDGQKRVIHWVWDNGIINDDQQRAGQIARMLLNRGDSNISQGTPMSWAMEGRTIAENQIYDTVPPIVGNLDAQTAANVKTVPLPADYARKKWPIVAQRLDQAGVRLAGILNKLLG